MPILPPNFNFPGAQQGIPQGIFSLIQGMSGLGGSGGPAQAPFNSNLSNTLGQLMQPRAPITPTTNPSLGQGFTLPPMPSVVQAPVVESRNPKDPIVAPVTGGDPVADEVTKYLDMLHANMGDNPAQRSIRNALQKNPPTGMEWKTNERNGMPISRTLIPTKKTPTPPVKSGGSK